MILFSRRTPAISGDAPLHSRNSPGMYPFLNLMASPFQALIVIFSPVTRSLNPAGPRGRVKNPCCSDEEGRSVNGMSPGRYIRPRRWLPAKARGAQLRMSKASVAGLGVVKCITVVFAADGCLFLFKGIARLAPRLRERCAGDCQTTLPSLGHQSPLS